MSWNIHEKNDYRYIDEGQGKVMLLLHGLFGAISNWDDVIRQFSERLSSSYSDVTSIRHARP